MNETLMQEILKRLDLIGAKLGEGGEFAWETFIRQEYWVNGWGQLAIVLLLGIIAGFLIKLAMWCGGEHSNPDYDKLDGGRYHNDPTVLNIEDETGRALAISACVVAAGICLAFSITGLRDGVGHIINPQYYALMDLAKMVGR